MPRLRLDHDRGFAVFLVVATVLSLISLALPELIDPMAQRWFSWGPEEIIGSGGWMIVGIAGLFGLVAAWRPS